MSQARLTMLWQGCRRFFPYRALIIVLWLFPALQPAQQTTVLYDGALGGTPDAQHFAYVALAEAAAQTFASGATTLDTTAVQGDQAGYFSTDHPPLDRAAGFSVLFTIRLDEEAHATPHRAGFSVTALSSDLQGIELGFWANEVWAQEGGTDALFTHAEGVSFDTTATLTPYELSIKGDEYILRANGAEILSGSLRDYTALESLIDPYETPNLLFFGDNTTRGQARVDIAYIALQTVALATSTPSPTTTAAATATASPTPTATLAAVPSATLTPTPQPKRDWNWWFPFTAGYPAP